MFVLKPFKPYIAVVFCAALLISLAGCRNRNDVVEVDTHVQFDAEREALTREIEHLHSLWERQKLLIEALEAELLKTQPTESTPAETQEITFHHGLTPHQVKTQLENDSYFIDFIGDNFPAWQPSWEGFTDNDTVEIYASYAVITIPTIWAPIVIFLSYHVDNHVVVWHIEGYSAPASNGFNPRHIPQPRRLTDLDVITIGFAYNCREIDPGVNFLPEAEKYHEEEIDGENLWAEFIRLMRYHTGIRVRDLWYEGTTLYVDLAPVEEIVFNWGSTGSWYRTSILFRTLATFPDVTEFVVLVGGVADVGADHFQF